MPSTTWGSSGETLEKLCSWFGTSRSRGATATSRTARTTVKSGGNVDANLTAVANVANLATAAGLDSHGRSDAATRGPVAMTDVTDALR